MSETLAVLGGSFDPPHMGHVLVAAFAQCQAEIDRVLVTPTYRHALDKDFGASFALRVTMARAAFRGLQDVEVSTIEEELGGTSLTLRTLEELTKRRPDANFRLVIGADILAETQRWHRFDAISEIAPPLIVGRAGFDSGKHETLEVGHVSSTEVRRRLNAGLNVDHLVPAAVQSLITEHQLYGVGA